MKAYKSLIEHAINDKGFVVSVYDGGEWAVKRSQNFKEIYAAIDSVEESQLVFRDEEGERMGWALIIDYDGEPENSVVDHTDNAWMTEWFDEYQATVK